MFNSILSTIGNIQFQLGTILLQVNGAGSQGVVAKIKEIYDFILPILNAIIILAALYGLFKVGAGFFQGHEGAGKKLVLIIVGVIIWFIAPIVIQSLLGSQTN